MHEKKVTTACVRWCLLSRLLYTDRGGEINGGLSSLPFCCIVLQQLLVLLVSCVSIMKSGDQYRVISHCRNERITAGTSY